MLGQIEQAFGERRASEERLRRFLSDASHELRTPLTSIRGYAELFRMGATSGTADTERAMARIEQEAARMGVLVEDLLALARLDEMPQSRREPVDLDPLLRDAAADARAAARDREVTVTVNGRSRRHRRPLPAAPGAREPDAQRAHAHPRRHTDRASLSGSPRRGDRGARPRPRPPRGRAGQRVRALLALRARARAGQGGCRPGPRDRRRDRGGTRRQRARPQCPRRWRGVHDRASAPAAA